MESTNKFYPSMKHVVYGALLTAAFSWPWIWTASTGGGVGDIVDLIALGVLPAVIIGAFIVYKETKLRPPSYKWAFAMALAGAFLLVWIMGAVGIFGRSGDPADLPYFGVLAVGIIGAIIARFRPQGMARALFAMAIAQIFVEVFGLIASFGSRIILNAFFAALWVGSALLFQKAGRDGSEPSVHNQKIL